MWVCIRALPNLTFALAVTLAGAANAQSPDAPAAAPESKPPPSEKVICVRGQAETGSHFGASKVCHTESEWAMIHNQSQHTMERYDTQNRQSAPAGGR
jgi:hypothetical protein